MRLARKTVNKTEAVDVWECEKGFEKVEVFQVNCGKEEALKTPVSVVNPESLIGFKADEVAGLDKPTYKVRLVDSNKQLKLYPININSIVLPKAECEYLFQLQVNWGNENHEIYYWFHVETQT